VRNLTLADLRSLERRTLQAISEIADFSAILITPDPVRNYRTTINEHSGGVNVHLSFEIDIRLRADVRKTVLKRRVDVGALVRSSSDGKSIDSASYSLIICKKLNPSTSAIIRKMHFDFEPGRLRNPTEPKPSTHLQICGLFSAANLRMGYRPTSIDRWYPDFEKPRIPGIPTTLALLINWLLLEFQTDRSARAILTNGRWRALIGEAEKLVLRPFFQEAADYFSVNQPTNHRFLENYVYEVP